MQEKIIVLPTEVRASISPPTKVETKTVLQNERRWGYKICPQRLFVFETQLVFKSSTSKIKVAPPGMSGPAPRSP